MKKRIVALFLVMSFCMASASCSDDGHSRRNHRDEDKTEETDETEETRETEIIIDIENPPPAETTNPNARPAPTSCNPIEYDMMYSHEGENFPSDNGWYSSLKFDFNFMQITDTRFNEAAATVSDEYQNMYITMYDLYLETCEQFYADLESDGYAFGYSFTDCIPYRVDDVAISYKVVTRPEPYTYDGEGYGYTNIDTATGGYIALENVVTDMDGFASRLIEAVEYMCSDSYTLIDNYESIIRDMLANGEVPFLLEADGIIVSFDYTTIITSEYGNKVEIKIPYFINSDIIDAYYFTAMPDYYSTNFSYNGECYADVDNNGVIEILSITDDADGEFGMVSNITIACDGESVTIEAYEYTPHAKLVYNHGKYYVLATVDSASDCENIYSFSLEGGHPEYVDSIAGFLPQFVNPNEFTVASRVHCLSSMGSEFDVTLTPDGHFQRLTDYVRTTSDLILVLATPLTGHIYNPDSETIEDYEVTIPAGTGVTVVRTDMSTYADMKVVDGPEHLAAIIRFDVDLEWSHTDSDLLGQLINGIPAEDAFVVTYYAG